MSYAPGSLHLSRDGRLFAETRTLNGSRYDYQVRDITPTGLRYRLGHQRNDAFIDGDAAIQWQDVTPTYRAEGRPCSFCGGDAFAPAHCPNCGAPKAGH